MLKSYSLNMLERANIRTKISNVRKWVKEDHASDPARSYKTMVRFGVLSLATKALFPEIPFNDIFGTTAEVALVARVMNGDGRRSVIAPMTLTLSTHVIREILSKYDVLPGALDGIYDVKDFVAYAVGGALWYGIEKASNRSRRRGRR